MQSYNTITDVIQMRQNECSLSVIQDRYGIGSGTVQFILKRFSASGFTPEQLKTMEPGDVELLFYPPENLQRKDIPLPDFQQYYDRIHAKGSKKPTMIVSQLPVAKWWDLFKDNTCADACLSRMTANAYRLECNGRDMRKA